MRKRTKLVTIALLIAAVAFLLSCNYSRALSPQEAAQTGTAAAQSAMQTEASRATSTLTPTRTPVPPTATLTPTPSPEPSATAACEDSSAFVSDVTIPDNMSMKPGQAFTKTWRLRNDGTCDWTTAFDAVRVGGASMGGASPVPLAALVPPDGVADISIDLTAPTANGVHRSSYQLRNADDILFGIVYYVQIVVGPTPTPDDGVYRSGRLTIDNGSSVDFDLGAGAGDSSAGRDLRVTAVSDSERYLEPVNGARLRMVSGTPDRDKCEATSLRDDAVDFADFDSGATFCYKTSDGRYGRFKVEKIEADSIGFNFRTWD